MKYYKVTCLQGHFGAGKQKEKILYICAKNMLHACNIAKKFPSICHDKFVINAKEITKEEYEVGLSDNLSKPFINDCRRK